MSAHSEDHRELLNINNSLRSLLLARNMPSTAEVISIVELPQEAGPTAASIKESMAAAATVAAGVAEVAAPAMPVEEEKPPEYDLREFQLTRILNNNSGRKTIAVLGTFPRLSETDQAVVVFEKKPFEESEVQTGPESGIDSSAPAAGDEERPAKSRYFTPALSVKENFINSVYGSYTCVPGQGLNGVNATVVYPATEKHIQKYSGCQRYLISETPYLYDTVTLPYVESSQLSLEWVYNILSHKQETERVIFYDNDPDLGFFLLPDLKWDGRNVDSLYLLAIVKKRHLKSLRDLTAAHIPLLKYIRIAAAKTIDRVYGVEASQLRMYFHYQPSFYHLHVHINLVKNDAPGIWCEKSHMLDTVITNLELISNYYKRATLPFVVYERTPLMERYVDKGVIQKRVPKRPREEDVEVAEEAAMQEDQAVGGTEKEEEAMETEAVVESQGEKEGGAVEPQSQEKKAPQEVVVVQGEALVVAQEEVLMVEQVAPTAPPVEAEKPLQMEAQEAPPAEAPKPPSVEAEMLEQTPSQTPDQTSPPAEAAVQQETKTQVKPPEVTASKDGAEPTVKRAKCDSSEVLTSEKMEAQNA